MLSGSEAEKAIIKLLDSCTSFSIAVAWATSNNVFKAIQKHKDKLGTLVVGVDFWQTHPDVLAWMQGADQDNMYVGRAKKGIFHPKVFFFEFEKPGSNVVIIGSANMTAAAYSQNTEACMRVKIKEADNSVIDAIKGWAKNGTPISLFNAQDYRKEYLLKGRMIRKSVKSRACVEFRENPDLLNLSFDDYYTLCFSDPYHYFHDRLALLEFCTKPTHSHDEFKCVAGIAYAQAPDDHFSFGLFGSMTADASFRDTVKHPAHWRGLYSIYNSVPAQGTIASKTAKGLMLDIQEHVNICFGNEYGKVQHLAAATRLLSMKRPDLYFCVNGANRSRIADDLGITVNGRTGVNTIDGYLATAEKLQKSTWGQSRAPSTTDVDKRSLWKGRIAMIDAIYYEPI